MLALRRWPAAAELRPTEVHGSGLVTFHSSLPSMARPRVRSGMRILMVNDFPVAGDGGGGAEVYIQRLSDGLTAAGDVVSTFARPSGRTGLNRALDVWDIPAQRAFREHLEAFRPDVVHVHNIGRELSVSVLRNVRQPVVASVHDHRLLGVLDDTYSRGHALMYKRLIIPFQRAVLRRTVSSTLPVSNALRRDLLAAGFPDVRVLPAIALEPTIPLQPAETCSRIVFIGRLARDKGCDLLVEAFAQLMTDFPDAQLVLIGDGPERAQLQQRCVPWGSRVQFTGRLSPDEVSAHLATAGVVAVPSVSRIRPEGFPLVAVEAAMHARPVVASDDPGLVEAVASLSCGVTVPAESPEHLKSALAQMLKSPDLTQQLGCTGRQNAAERHSVGAVTATARAIYAEVLTRHS